MNVHTLQVPPFCRALTSLALWAVVCLLLSSAAAQQFSDWSTPANLGPPINTPAIDAGAFISKDGLSLYLVSNRPGGFGSFDLWVAQRDSTEEPWREPQNLGPSINTAANESTPTISPDGHRLYFASGQPGGFGSGDLYVSRRKNKRDDFAWEAAVNLGGTINTAANEIGPAFLKVDESDSLTMYFSSDLSGSADIYATTLQPDEQFTTPVLVQELSTPFIDQRPAIRRDGLEIIFDSDRPGGHGSIDLWVSTRQSTSEPWGAPENLGPDLNTSGNEGRPALSFDRSTLYFLSTRPGGLGQQDIYISTRTKIKGPE